MAINEKLNHIKETKELIRQALINKGVEVTEEDSFRSYANKIADIPQEGGDPYYEDLYNLRTSNGTNMAGLFARANGDKLDLTVLDTSKCTDMQYMFNYCKFKNIDCSGWDISKVANVQYMFDNCSSNINTTGWDTSGWTSLNRSFNYFTGSIDISNWNLDNVTDVQYMFAYADLKNVKGIPTIKLPKVKSYQYLFNSSTCDTLDLSQWDIGNVTDMQRLLYNSKIRRIDLSNWNTSNVTNMTYAFNFGYSCPIEELIIPDWDMTKTTSYSNLFPSSASNIAKLKYIDLSRSNDLTISRITSFLPKRTITTYGDVVIPADSSQEVIDGLIAKYWRPVGVTSTLENLQIISELDELKPGHTTKIVFASVSPWYFDTNNIEFISSDESIATVNDKGVVEGKTFGSVEIYARLKGTQDVFGNAVTVTITNEDSQPNVVKFRSQYEPTTSYYITVNSKRVNLQNMEYHATTKIFEYDAEEPITSIKFDSSGLTELIKLNTSNITSMYQMFYNLSHITSLDLSSWDTSNVTNMGWMFRNCSSLTSLDLTSWSTGKVTNASSMFGSVPSTCHIYVDDVLWTLTEKETDFKGTFIRVKPEVPEYHTEYYTDYTIDTSVATFSMNDTIQDGAYLPELSNGYTYILLKLNNGTETTDLSTEASLVSSIRIYYPEETSYIKFANTKVKEVTHLNGTNITDCTGMFTNCVYLESADLSTLDSSKVVIDETMFEGVNENCKVTVNDDWDITEEDMGWDGYYNPYFVEYTIAVEEGSTETLDYTYSSGAHKKYLPIIYTKSIGTVDFKDPKDLDFITIKLKDGSTTNSLGVLAADVDSISVEYPEDTYRIQFGYGYSYEHKAMNGLKHIEVKNITDMREMFRYCSSLTTLDVSNWNVSKVTDMEHMFAGCSSLISLDVSNWDICGLKKTRFMFSGCSSLISLDVSNWDTSNLTSIENMFNGCSSLISLDVSNWDTSNVKDMQNMFNECSSLTSLDVSNWDTSGVINIGWMFNGCSSLTSLDVSNWDVSNAYGLGYMFNNCSSLTSLDVSNWNTENVTSLDSTFYNCSSLTSLDVSKWNTGKVTSLYGTFNRCSSLTSLDLSKWNTGKVTNMNGTFGSCNFTSLDVSNWNTDIVTNMAEMFSRCSSLTSLDLSKWNTGNVTTMYGMFNTVPSNIDWHYDGTNYTNWTLTESQTGYKGTFPWNQ